MNFFSVFRLRRTLRVNFRWNLLVIDQDNLRTKLNWCCEASHEHKLRFLVLTSQTLRPTRHDCLGNRWNELKWRFVHTISTDWDWRQPAQDGNSLCRPIYTTTLCIITLMFMVVMYWWSTPLQHSHPFLFPSFYFHFCVPFFPYPFPDHNNNNTNININNIIIILMLFCCMTVCRPLTARTDDRTHLCIA